MERIKSISAEIAQSHRFTTIIFILILINAILVGLETYPYFADNYADWIYIADTILLWIFTIEIVIRFLGSGSIKSYFKNPWNVFDFIIVMSSHLLVGGHYVTVLRILRVLRVMRAVSVIPSLRKMVNALLLSIPSMGTILLLLGIFFYIYGVIGTTVFRDVAPEYFGTLHDTLLALVQFITMDSWSSAAMRPMLENAPFAWIYFISFIVIGAFIIVNLFVGVVVGNVEKAARDEEPSPADVKLETIEKELQEIKNLLQQKNKL